MEILQQDISLKKYNTFQIEAKANYFYEYTRTEEILDLLKNDKFQKIRKFIIGEGSNLLFVKDFAGLIIHPYNKGVKILAETDDFVKIDVQAGENWDDLVAYTVTKKWSGLENLSLIPGQVGASPVQNIGAYGVEVSEFIEKVEAIHLETGKKQEFTKADCQFGYRDSVFKNELKNQFIVNSVVFKLSKKNELRTHYKGVSEELEKTGIPTIANLRQAIINIRTRILPEPFKIGNAGSFFKNPIIRSELAANLKAKYPEMVTYKVSEQETKIAAGWLIEYCGWKGYRQNNAGVHTNSALVLVNYGKATGNEIAELAQNIIRSVKNTFNITLDPEVNFIQ